MLKIGPVTTDSKEKVLKLNKVRKVIFFTPYPFGVFLATSGCTLFWYNDKRLEQHVGTFRFEINNGEVFYQFNLILAVTSNK